MIFYGKEYHYTLRFLYLFLFSSEHAPYVRIWSPKHHFMLKLQSCMIRVVWYLMFPYRKSNLYHAMTHLTFSNLPALISDLVSWQVEHMLNDRLLNFVDIDLHDVTVLVLFPINTKSWKSTLKIIEWYFVDMQDAHKRFDKASLSYDQVMLFLACECAMYFLFASFHR